MKRIALIEDNADNRLLIRVLLRDRYEVVEYETGSQAWAGLQQLPPDLVLMDLSLPDLEGAEVLNRIRSCPRLGHLPVIAVTAQAMAGDRERFLGLGFTDYVTKPIVDFDLFLQSVERALAGPA
jgi:CheY-like chemotaxis protein